MQRTRVDIQKIVSSVPVKVIPETLYYPDEEVLYKYHEADIEHHTLFKDINFSHGKITKSGIPIFHMVN
jgi:hypothetical protein